MKSIIAAAAFLIPLATQAETPADVRINTVGTFDANMVYTGTYVASGAINEVGAQADTPVFSGAAIHVTKLLTTTIGDYITVAINSNHVAGTRVPPPDWCPPPPTPAGAFLFREEGNWKVVAGTGSYASLQGTGAHYAWVIIDTASNRPVAATECLVGKVQYLN